MLVRFIAVRTAALAAVCALIAAFIDGLGLIASPGVLLGAFVAVYKIKIFGSFLDGLVKSREHVGKKPLIFQLFSQLLVFSLLLASAFADLRIFAGIAAGLLLPMLCICVNAVTEKANITHNLWGLKEEAVACKK